jgi:hypothetical protein
MMKVNKNMIIAVTITFCFIATLLMVIPIRSQSSGQYDPWFDINDDGRINMDEIVASTTAFGATGDPTKNVNVTNWIPPEPTIEWCGDYSIQWNSSGVQGGPVGNVPLLNVKNYEKMTVILNFSSVHVQAGYCYIFVSAHWSVSPTFNEAYSERLASTLYQLQPQASALAISTDWYPVKEPYVWVSAWAQANTDFPSSIGGNATFSVYVYLSNGATAGSLRKTMSWIDYEELNADSNRFASFFLDGFSQMTIHLGSNVTWTVYVQKMVGIGGSINIDVFTLTGDTYKTYALDGEYYSILAFSPSAKPWMLYCSFYVVA